MNGRKTFISLLCTLLFLACSKDESSLPESRVRPIDERSIEFKIAYLHPSQSNKQEIPLSRAIVSIYEADYERDEEYQPLMERYSDTTGIARFMGLEKEQYFFLITHPEHGKKLGFVTTPANSKSYVNILY